MQDTTITMRMECRARALMAGYPCSILILIAIASKSTNDGILNRNFRSFVSPFALRKYAAAKQHIMKCHDDGL